jgi:hypothetical protein
MLARLDEAWVAIPMNVIANIFNKRAVARGNRWGIGPGAF